MEKFHFCKNINEESSSFLDQRIADYPEITTCRIKLVISQAMYQVRPDFVLPYMVGKTDAVEKAWLQDIAFGPLHIIRKN